MMNDSDMTLADIIRRHRVIAIMRHLPDDLLVPVFSALADAGIYLIEVTMNTAAATAQIEKALAHFDRRMLIGAGTVSNPDRARAALAAGAQFLVTPNLDLAVIELAHRHRCPVIPGVLTPTEMMTAVGAGVSILKLFPAVQMGTAYVKDVLAPLNELQLVAVGGVTAQNAGDWIDAGCIGIGMGSALFDPTLLKNRQFGAITRQVRQFLDQLTT